jgi:hypothetical protein
MKTAMPVGNGAKTAGAAHARWNPLRDNRYIHRIDNRFASGGVLTLCRVRDLKWGCGTLYVWTRDIPDDSRCAKGFAHQLDKGLT